MKKLLILLISVGKGGYLYTAAYLQQDTQGDRE
jgi:hypothetical protein